MKMIDSDNDNSDDMDDDNDDELMMMMMRFRRKTQQCVVSVNWSLNSVMSSRNSTQ